MRISIVAVAGTVGLTVALAHSWVAPPLVGPTNEVVWGGRQQQVQCWFDSGSTLACKLNGGEVPSRCSDYASCEMSPGGTVVCTVDKARRLYDPDGDGPEKGRWWRHTVERADGYEEYEESGQKLRKKRIGGASEKLTVMVPCFEVEKCKNRCVPNGSTYRCTVDSVQLENPQPDETPHPDFPCPP